MSSTTTTTQNPALPKGYEPAEVEARWRSYWEENKSFAADVDAGGKPYAIVIPPPNVTGVLHMGHALNLTIQDILCRHHRQLGHKVLWVPGTDHAGIATQNVVERALAKEKLTRDDLGREKFIERVWAWKEDYGNRILEQISAMGASVDWTRLRFTMDEGLSKAVRKVFVDLYHKGLIYKGDYIINWCSRCHTALADDEVEHANRKSKLWHIRYRLADGTGHITIATTRPETILGDTAVCVHPDDERYRDLIGKKVYVPIIKREVPIIADNYVDMDFGSGALKVTPSHDHNDWALGKKHNLQFIQAIDDKGFMKDVAGPYAGLGKEECRKRIVEDIEAQGDLEQIEEIENAVGHCYRCETVVEPHVSTQWFVAATKLAPRARAAMLDCDCEKNGGKQTHTRIFPGGWLKTYHDWLDNIRDWCISRQIWWGHRIPAWTCQSCGELIVAEDAPQSCRCGSTDLKQDDDVLDTWFSSALWPFSTMGWPDKTKELAMFYPTAVLVTAFDILFFWVARMMMLGLHCMDEVPFKHVYMHALVRDAKGRKMSKSIGNAIDPLEMIKKYGCDALRFTLTSFAAMGRDIKLSEDRIEGYRHFVNKIWNAARFSLMNLPETRPEPVAQEKLGALHHYWILQTLEKLKSDVAAAIAGYNFNEAAQSCYNFLWSDFCDWYLEIIKLDMAAGGERKDAACHVLYTVLSEFLVVAHPIMPFVTAEIWQFLPGRAGADLSGELYPAPRPIENAEKVIQDMNFIKEAIVCIRTIRAELNISPAKKLKVFIQPSKEQAPLLEDYRELIMSLARLESFVVEDRGAAHKGSASASASGCPIHMPLQGAVDLDAELARLDKEMGKVDKNLQGLSAKLADEKFINNAPSEFVEKERARLDVIKEEKSKMKKWRDLILESLEGGE